MRVSRIGDRISLSIAKNHPKPSQEFSEQFGPSTHRMKGFSQKRKISPKRKFSAGRPCGYPAKNFGQALQILKKASILAQTCHADVHEKTSVWKTSGWSFVPYLVGIHPQSSPELRPKLGKTNSWEYLFWPQKNMRTNIPRGVYVYRSFSDLYAIMERALKSKKVCLELRWKSIWGERPTHITFASHFNSTC